MNSLLLCSTRAESRSQAYPDMQPQAEAELVLVLATACECD